MFLSPSVAKTGLFTLFLPLFALLFCAAGKSLAPSPRSSPLRSARNNPTRIELRWRGTPRLRRPLFLTSDGLFFYLDLSIGSPSIP